MYTKMPWSWWSVCKPETQVLPSPLLLRGTSCVQLVFWPTLGGWLGFPGYTSTFSQGFYKQPKIWVFRSPADISGFLLLLTRLEEKRACLGSRVHSLWAWRRQCGFRKVTTLSAFELWKLNLSCSLINAGKCLQGMMRSYGTHWLSLSRQNQRKQRASCQEIEFGLIKGC